MNRVLRLMAILAHPDDESLGTGGILAKYAAERVETSLIVATHGQNGRYLHHRDGPDYPGPEKLGAIREAELRAAAEVLGVSDLTLLGYEDRYLDQAPPREAVARIAGHIRRLRPQVVVTFPPDGGYGHPDHIAISQLAASAALAAADPRAPVEEGDARLEPHAISKLYYMVFPEEEAEIYQRVFKRLTSVVDGVERVAAPWPEWQATTLVDARAHWRTVWNAVRCHRSQMDSYQGLTDLPDELQERLWGRPHFYRALSTVNGGRKRETDLFEGLRG